MTIRIARLLAAIGVALSIGGLLFLSTKANAQQVICEDLAWSGVTPMKEGVVRTMLFQSDRKTWTLAVVQGTQACIIGMGVSATPMVAGRDA